MIEWRRQHHNPFNGEQEVRIKLIGVGGTGSNVLDRVLLDGIDKADLVAVNTDIQSLRSSVASRKVQLGKTLTCGLGAGGDPEVGYMAALEAEKELLEVLDGVPLLFICVGLGGGTGSGAAPVIANLARQQGSFVVVFATLPFEFEGKRRVQQAQQALEQIYQSADCVICFENERLGEAVLPKAGIHKAFSFADQTISQSVRAIATLVNTPGLIEIGFDELLTVMRNHEPRCLFGYGEAEGADRALEALNETLKSPLMDRGRLLSGADSVLVNITGGETLTLHEVSTLMTELNKHIHDNTHILMGAAVDKKLGQKLSVTIISSISNEEYGVLSDRRPRMQSTTRESLPSGGGSSGGSYNPGAGGFGSASGEGAHPEALAVLPGTPHGPISSPWARATPGVSRPGYSTSAPREPSGSGGGGSILGAARMAQPGSERPQPNFGAPTEEEDRVPGTRLGEMIFGGDIPDSDLHDDEDQDFSPDEDAGEENAFTTSAEDEAYSDVTSGALAEPEAAPAHQEQPAAATAEQHKLPYPARTQPQPISGSAIRIGPVRLSPPKDFAAAEEPAAETAEPAGEAARPRRLLFDEADPVEDAAGDAGAEPESGAETERDLRAATRPQLPPRPIPPSLAAYVQSKNPAPAPEAGSEPAPEAAAAPAAKKEEVPDGDRGRFEASEPTLIDGQDFDIPTFLRRGIKFGKR